MRTLFQQYSHLVELSPEQSLTDMYVENRLHMRVYQPPVTEQEKRLQKQALANSGIQFAETNKYAKHTYRFYICQFSCFALFHKVSQHQSGKKGMLIGSSRSSRWKRISATTSTKEVNKARKLAIRTLYCLGYDLGVVDIVVRSNAPRFSVAQISNHFFANESIRNQAEQVLNKYDKSWTEDQTKESKLGADIEFVLRHATGKYVLASKYLSKKGKVGYDAIWVRGHRGKHPIVELRPDPFQEPLDLVQDIYNCMHKVVTKISNPRIKWLAGGVPLKGYPIGGHIHFSGISLQSKFIRALDNYLTLPLFMIESDTSLERRPKYGVLGDVRQQFHGGFEYRTPPSWIVSPQVAKGVLCLARVIAIHYKELTWMPLNNLEYQVAFYQKQKESLQSIVAQLQIELRQCAAYDTYEKELNAFFDLARNQKQWNEYEDIRKAWQLPPY